jgi:glycyl-tRNA synthetase beta chain
MLEIVRRVEALSALLGSEDGQNLLAGYRRAANILAAEEKKDGRSYGGDVAFRDGQMAEEASLQHALTSADTQVRQAVAGNDYDTAIRALATLRGPVDAFFEAVLVNDADPAVRINRLNLLAGLRDTMRRVADFSKVAG